MDWMSAETAPKDGTIFEGRHDRLGEFSEPRQMKWGVGLPHIVTSDLGNPMPGYVVNEGKPWWLNADGIKMAPVPTEWRPTTPLPKERDE